jgi:hypothetical protein
MLHLFKFGQIRKVQLFFSFGDDASLHPQVVEDIGTFIEILNKFEAASKAEAEFRAKAETAVFAVHLKCVLVPFKAIFLCTVQKAPLLKNW